MARHRCGADLLSPDAAQNAVRVTARRPSSSLAPAAQPFPKMSVSVRGSGRRPDRGLEPRRTRGFWKSLRLCPGSLAPQFAAGGTQVSIARSAAGMAHLFRQELHAGSHMTDVRHASERFRSRLQVTGQGRAERWQGNVRDWSG